MQPRGFHKSPKALTRRALTRGFNEKKASTNSEEGTPLGPLAQSVVGRHLDRGKKVAHHIEHMWMPST